MGRLLGLGVRERRYTGQTFAEPVIPPYPGATVGGAHGYGSHNPDTALMVPAVWACVSLLANAVSMLPLETFRRVGQVPNRLTDPPLLTNPSGDMTQSEWLHMLMVSLLMRGNAYGVIVARDGMMRAKQIDLASPDMVSVKVDKEKGTVEYKIGQKPIPFDDMWHVRGLTMPGQKVGLSPISYAAAVVGLDLSSRRFAEDFFAGGGVPKATIMSDQAVDQKQARTIKERFLTATQDREPVVLGAGLKYQRISIAPEEAQFLATQQATVAQIARYFNIPAGLVGGTEGGSMTYSNVEQRSIDFLTFAVSFWLKRIEDAVFPLLAQPQYVQFNTAKLLRTDAETQVKVDVQLIAGKIKTPSEVRAERQMPPMTDEQKAEADMVPLTITPTGGAKALPALKEPVGPVAPVPADDLQGDPSNG